MELSPGQARHLLPLVEVIEVAPILPDAIAHRRKLLGLPRRDALEQTMPVEKLLQHSPRRQPERQYEKCLRILPRDHQQIALQPGDSVPMDAAEQVQPGEGQLRDALRQVTKPPVQRRTIRQRHLAEFRILPYRHDPPLPCTTQPDPPPARAAAGRHPP
ncbi:MAG: hypothetical protein A2Y76_02000 [Planctomycetes bacterium RBG_13_60_9]|nr:MAG: hypothetical protein A2Y76_02000 [Planctomycetes bacterium RBG_13_60_9]